MAEQNNISLPDDDKDLILAKRIGHQISSAASIRDIDDPLVELLTHYSQSEIEKIHQLSSPSDSTWSRIHRQITDRRPVRVIPFYQRSVFKAWIAAAAIILIAFVGWVWFIQPTPELVAESQGSIEQITLSDGSEVTLRPYSKLYHSNERNYSLEGEGFFDVKHDPEHPFSVTIDDAKITVLGTRFNASAWGDQPRIYLEEGSVRFEEISTNKAIILEPGQASTMQEGELQLLETEAVDEAQYTDWLNSTLVLNNSSFEELIQEIEQHFNIDITLSDPDFEADSINGSYRLSSVDSTLIDIGLVVGGTFRRQTGNRFIFENSD